MVEVWDWLAQNAGAVSAVSTVLLAVITAVYAYLTGRAVGAAKDSAASAAHLVQLEVLPVVYVHPRSLTRGTNPGFGWEVTNVGQGAALAVRCWAELDDGTHAGELKLDRPLSPGETQESARLNATINEVAALQDQPPRATRVAEFQDALGRKYRSSFRGAASHVYQVMEDQRLEPLR